MINYLSRFRPFINLPIHATVGPIVKASITVPMVRCPPTAMPMAIARKSQAMRTAKKGRWILELMMVGMASYGANPVSEFMYKATDMRKKTRAMANVTVR